MSVPVPAIAMCWDGETQQAELRIDGAVFIGEARDVERAFSALNKLRDRATSAEDRLAAVARRLDEVSREFRR